LADTRVDVVRFVVDADFVVDFGEARFVVEDFVAVVVRFAVVDVPRFADRDAVFVELFVALLRGVVMRDVRSRVDDDCLADALAPFEDLFDRPLAGFATYVAES